jgi:hypothetical protein
MPLMFEIAVEPPLSPQTRKVLAGKAVLVIVEPLAVHWQSSDRSYFRRPSN